MVGIARNVFVFLALSGAAVATWMLGRPPAPAVEPRQAAAAAPLGSYLRDAVILGTDASGAVIYRIFAAHAEQPQHGDSLELAEVRVEYAAREDIPWVVTAAAATASRTGEWMRLHGGVRLSSRPGDAADAIVLETQEFELDPEAHVARGTHPLTVSRGGASLDAVGFSADLKGDTLELVGVHAQFDR